MFNDIKPPKNENILVFTEKQLRDRDIYITFNTMKSLGLRRSEAISILMSRYSLSYNSIERAIYPQNN